jgi:branched-chain amino acid transport system permease protein
MYAILAVGFSLVFGVARIMNLAHTALYMVGAYIIFAATSTLGMAALWATLLAVSITGLLGIAIYKLCYERVRQHETAVMIIAIALTILLQEIP